MCVCVCVCTIHTRTSFQVSDLGIVCPYKQADDMTTSRAHLESEMESLKESHEKQKRDSEEKL